MLPMPEPHGAPNPFSHTLFLCHGRLHIRHVWWFPLLNSPAAKPIWDRAKYLDISPDVSPNHVADLTTDLRHLFPPASFDAIIPLNCVYTVYGHPPSVNTQYWRNVAFWLKKGGVYLSQVPLLMALPERLLSTYYRRQLDVKKTPSFHPFVEELHHSKQLSMLKHIQGSLAHTLLHLRIKRHHDFKRLAKYAVSVVPAYEPLVRWLLQQKPTQLLPPDSDNTPDPTVLKALDRLREKVSSVTGHELAPLPLSDVRQYIQGSSQFCFLKT
ncbi:g9343 [Coccomyxa elongata]